LWGGSKESEKGIADSMDVVALDRLVALRDELQPVFHGTEMKGQAKDTAFFFNLSILFCDVHHYIANGKRYDAICSYNNSLEKLVKERNMGWQYLKYYQWPNFRIGKNDNDFLNHIGYLDARLKARELLSSNPGFASAVMDAAKKHSLWAKQGYALEHIVKLYVQIEIEFLQSIAPNKGVVFISFSDPTIQRPIAEAADVPMLYFHSLGKTRHECPWYVAGEPL
ncbi:MAG: hypothetical protein V1743_00060, partial [Nanoarchaeota archaeon]